MKYKRDCYGNSEMCLNIMLGDNSFWNRKNPESDGLMTETEFDAYIEAIREALTDGGNLCDVDAQDNLISIDGNAGGNLDRFSEILAELYARGCWLECDICVDGDGNCEQYETSLAAHLEELLERANNFGQYGYFYCDECDRWHPCERSIHGTDMYCKTVGDNPNIFAGYEVYKHGKKRTVCRKCQRAYYSINCCECGRNEYEDEMDFYLFDLGQGYLCHNCATKLGLLADAQEIGGYAQ